MAGTEIAMLPSVHQMVEERTELGVCPGVWSCSVHKVRQKIQTMPQGKLRICLRWTKIRHSQNNQNKCNVDIAIKDNSKKRIQLDSEDGSAIMIW